MDLFFSKCGNLDLDFKNAIKTSEKVFVLEIITFELVAGIFLNSEDKTCHSLSKC